MHEALAEQILKDSRQRSSEGDHPTIKPHGTEMMEEALISVADQRDTLQAALQALDGEITRLRSALEIIAGRKQCIDNLLGNSDVARLALDTHRNL